MLTSPTSVWSAINCGLRCQRVVNCLILHFSPSPFLLASGIDSVVVGCLRIQSVEAHAKNGSGMTWVQSDWRACGLAKVFGIGTVVHHSIMHRGAAQIGCCPPDYRQLLFRQFDGRALSDACDFGLRWSLLSGQVGADFPGARDRRNVTDGGCAGRQWRSGDQELSSLESQLNHPSCNRLRKYRC